MKTVHLNQVLEDQDQDLLIDQSGIDQSGIDQNNTDEIAISQGQWKDSL